MFENIEGVVAITNDLYVESKSALKNLLIELRKVGYRIKSLRNAEYRKRDNVSIETMEKNGWSLWYARLDVRRGKCKTCNGLIDMCGIQSHGHQCELCGAVTYYEIIDGSKVRFSFVHHNGDESAYDFSCLTMKAKRWDADAGHLYFYREILDDGSLGLRGERVEQYFAAHQDKWEEVEEDGVRLIRVKYSKSGSESAVSLHDVWGHYWNHKIVRIWEGKEYNDYSSDFPVLESVSIIEAWHWAPLQRSPHLHEKIIHAAGMVGDCGYYYQDGRAAFYDVHLQRMRTFVKHFTKLNLDNWDRMIRYADKSGPGMIKAVAHFCHEYPEIENRPNIGNLLVGVSKMMASGQRLTNNEMSAMADAAKDPEIEEEFFKIFKRLPRR